MKPFLLLILIVSVLASGTTNVSAQTISPVMMQMVSAELQKRGLTESEVRIRLLKEGIDLESVPPAELPSYQSRVVAILDKMQAEKKAAGQISGTTGTQAVNINVGSTTAPGVTPINSAASTVTMPDGTIVPAGNQLNTPTPVAPVTTPEEAAAEASQRVIQAAAAKDLEGIKIYGHSLFIDKSLDVYRTTDGAQAPDTYVLGQGDEIHITIFGASQTDIQQRIASDGSIQPTGGAKIFLKGLTLAQAREVIRKNLSTSYLFRGDQIAVTIITARTIMVNVFGEARITGGFSISALNSAFNALSAAGGPTAIGSVRAIQLIRGNSRKTIDLYDFMNDPAAQFKFDLQNNDIIFVPVRQKQVSIEGAVKRPMDYEMLANETLIDLIQYAGGLTKDVYPDFVQIQRFENGQEKLAEWNLVDITSGKIKVPLLHGDIVQIKKNRKPMDQYVEVEGSVYYPGRFDLTSNSTLSKLIANAKPTYEAKTDILFIERIRPDQTVELLTIPFPNIKIGISDFKLEARDNVRIMDQASYRDIANIAVNGQVRKPFEKAISLNDHLTVKQAIEMAGGLKTSVYPVAYIFRKNLFNPTKITYIRIELSESDNVQLQAGDQLNIYDNTTYTNVGELKVFGAVKTPKNFTFDASMSVQDLLTNAGGFNVGAAYNRVEVFRTVLSPTEKTKLQLITLSVDSSYQVISPKNFSLQPFDQVVVRLVPEFTLGRTIELNGQVKYPGTYVLESKQTKLSDVVKMAGGLLNDADPYGALLFRTYNKRGNISMNVRDAIRHPRSESANPILFEGDVININRLENTVSILETGTRMAQYSINPEANTLKNVVYQGRKSARWYIKNFAGGFQKLADRNSVTVTFPNNQMQSTKHFLGFRIYPKVESGSIITMKMDTEKLKLEGEPKEKLDLETSVAKGLSMLMSTLSVILLLQRL
ncbi:MAG: SLBB domain-containing protein [Paludibacter sp.]|nr:SLBB domain-containing protein [Paludibacter sp.]